MLTKENIADLVRPLANERGLELVEIQLQRGRRVLLIRVFVDRVGGVTMGDCADLNRQIRERLDGGPGIAEDHRVEVSSAGMQRPIWTREHFERFCGEKAVIELREPREGHVRFTGRIAAVAGESVVLQLEDGDRIELQVADLVAAHVDLDPWKQRS